MQPEELVKAVQAGEDSKHQFKETITDAKKIAEEITAFANSLGGMIFIGVDKFGTITGVKPRDVEKINRHIANATTINIRPAINVLTENIDINGRNVMVVYVKEGLNKPYCTNDGAFWVKNGSDKRKVTAPEDIQRLFQSSGKLYAGETPIEGTSLDDVNWDKFSDYFRKIYKREYTDVEHPPEVLLEKLNLAKGGRLNLAGLLLFGKNPARFRPAFMIKAISFFGSDPAERV